MLVVFGVLVIVAVIFGGYALHLSCDNPVLTLGGKLIYKYQCLSCEHRWFVEGSKRECLLDCPKCHSRHTR